MHIMANTQDTIIGRPLKSFDLPAFCSYNSFHPSEYLPDNNWDILCAFVQSGSAAKLDSLGIPYNRSQLRLLEVGDLLMCNNEHYTTKMHFSALPHLHISILHEGGLTAAFICGILLLTNF